MQTYLLDRGVRPEDVWSYTLIMVYNLATNRLEGSTMTRKKMVYKMREFAGWVR